MRWLVLLMLGCGTPPASHPTDPPKPTDRPRPVDAAAPGSAAPTSLDRAQTDPPEPVEPQAECVFARSVFCVPGAGHTDLPEPFATCKPTQPAHKNSVVPGDAKFSATETRAKRQD